MNNQTHRAAAWTRKKDTGEPGNPGQFGTATKTSSGIQLTPEQDLTYDVLEAAQHGRDVAAVATARGLDPAAAERISHAARTAAAYLADDGIDRALDLDPTSPEAIVDIEDYATGSDGDRWGEAPQAGYDYEGWTHALAQAWQDETRRIVTAELRAAATAPLRHVA